MLIQRSAGCCLRLIAVSVLIGMSFVPPECAGQEIVSVKKIWDKASHNAFTDLIYFRDRWYCVFREGQGHVSPDGALRVITSVDGEQWESAAIIRSNDSDLRDAKICATPDGRLMLSGAGALHDKSVQSHQSLVWFSEDGHTWGGAIEVADPDYWLWRITWSDDLAYGVGYRTAEPRQTRLYRSENGEKYEILVDRLNSEGYPNESSIVFENDHAYCLLRRDGQPKTGLLGTSVFPYTTWQWRDLGVQIGGPHMLRHSDGRLVAAVRLYDAKVRTSLCWVDKKGALEEFLTLPSGGDTSYAGMIFHDDLLWVSYYSSHEGKTSIYLAKVKLPVLQN